MSSALDLSRHFLRGRSCFSVGSYKIQRHRRTFSCTIYHHRRQPRPLKSQTTALDIFSYLGTRAFCALLTSRLPTSWMFIKSNVNLAFAVVLDLSFYDHISALLILVYNRCNLYYPGLHVVVPYHSSRKLEILTFGKHIYLGGRRGVFLSRVLIPFYAFTSTFGFLSPTKDETLNPRSLYWRHCCPSPSPLYTYGSCLVFVYPEKPSFRPYGTWIRVSLFLR